MEILLQFPFNLNEFLGPESPVTATFLGLLLVNPGYEITIRNLPTKTPSGQNQVTRFRSKAEVHRAAKVAPSVEWIYNRFITTS